MDANDLIKAYSQDPINNFIMDDRTVKYTQENGVCGDNVTVFLKISEDEKIEQYSFSGYPQLFTKAAASMLAEVIEGKTLDEVFQRDYEFMRNLGLEVSPRRKRSIVSALLAAKNAIHEYRKDGIVEGYDDLIENY